jgi:hypothetical protein
MAVAIQNATSTSFKPIWPDLAPEQQAVERLEAEITELWGHLNAATYRFLVLLAEFDRREGWALHGLANCAQWLNWQCGIGALAAREKVRVARALEGLPELSAAFRQGRLSYSKVRALTRIATAANEKDLRNIAEHGTAAHVDRLVAKYRRVERLEEAAQANTTHRNRSLYYFYDEDGSLVIHAKLPAEVGAIVKKAIEEALALVEEDARQDEPKAASEGSEAQSTEPAEPNANQTQSNVPAETIPPPIPEASEATHERRDLLDTLGAKRADGLRLLAETFLARQSESCGSRWPIASRSSCISISGGWRARPLGDRRRNRRPRPRQRARPNRWASLKRPSRPLAPATTRHSTRSRLSAASSTTAAGWRWRQSAGSPAMHRWLGSSRGMTARR